MYWEHNGEVGFGLGFGASGIALLFAFLNAASPEPRLLEAAAQGLDFEMANARWGFGRIVWPDLKADSAKVPLTPHTRFGTSGVGTAAVRLYAVTGEQRFRRLAEMCAFTASLRLGNKLWQDFGLSGQGEFLLDMARFLADDIYHNNALHIADILIRHAIRKPEGIAFAGVDLLRISCDFAVGSAGIGWYLHRLLNPNRSRLLLPDHLLEKSMVPLAGAQHSITTRPALVNT
jgi:lantibiotic modifying enzyme